MRWGDFILELFSDISTYLFCYTAVGQENDIYFFSIYMETSGNQTESSTLTSWLNEYVVQQMFI